MSRSKVIVNFTWTKTFPCFNSRGNDSSKYRCKTLTWRLSVSQRWRQRMKGNILFLNFHLSFLNVKSIFSRTVSSLGQLSVSTEPSFKIWRKLSYGSFQSPFIQSFFFFFPSLACYLTILKLLLCSELSAVDISCQKIKVVLFGENEHIDRNILKCSYIVK